MDLPQGTLQSHRHYFVRRCTTARISRRSPNWLVTVTLVFWSAHIANGTDVATAASLLGHAQPSATPNIYIHAFGKSKKAASETLQQSLKI